MASVLLPHPFFMIRPCMRLVHMIK